MSLFRITNKITVEIRTSDNQPLIQLTLEFYKKNTNLGLDEL